VKAKLEAILEAALREQPFNFVAFMINKLCAGGGGGGAAFKPASAAELLASVAPAVVDDVSAAVLAPPAAEPAAPPAAAAAASASPEQIEAFFDAVQSGDLDAMVAALEGGVPVTALNDDGATALHVAAEGEPGLVEELIKRGCEVDATNAEGKTALVIAVVYEDLDVCQVLVGAGADKELADEEDKTPIDYARECSDLTLRAFITGEEVEEEKEEERPLNIPAKPRRNSVSSESIDPRKKVDTSKIKVVEKTDEVKERIKSCVKDSILFKGLDAETLEAVVMSMEEKAVATGEFIIQQGEEGHYFYVVDSGSFDCFVLAPECEPPGKLVMQYGPHTSFGELALMYNAPRAASVKATGDSVLWAMDRVTFRTMLMQKMVQKRIQFEALLDKVGVLKSLSPYDKSAIADVLSEETFCQGSTICEEGDKGSALYIVAKGEAVAEKGGKTVATYAVGDYFGEFPLLTGDASPISVKAPMTDCSVVSIEASHFGRLFRLVKAKMQKLAEESSVFKS